MKVIYDEKEYELEDFSKESLEYEKNTHPADTVRLVKLPRSVFQVYVRVSFQMIKEAV